MAKKLERYEPIPPEQPTLRDRFAMAALTGMLAEGSWVLEKLAISNRAYRFADEMLESRDLKGA
jgi:hypothetical protein